MGKFVNKWNTLLFSYQVSLIRLQHEQKKNWIKNITLPVTVQEKGTKPAACGVTIMQQMADKNYNRIKYHSLQML